MELDHYKVETCVSTVKKLADLMGIDQRGERLQVLNERIAEFRQRQDALYEEIDALSKEINRLIDDRTLAEDAMDSIALLEKVENALAKDDTVSSV